jgi:hypothetical protein
MVLAENPVRKRPLRRPSLRWEDIVKRCRIVERWPRLVNKSNEQRDLEDWMFDGLVLEVGHTQEEENK